MWEIYRNSCVLNTSIKKDGHKHANFYRELSVSEIPKIFYYWFVVGEGILPLHHLNSDFTPTRLDILPL
jgi:hypothetical protein